MNISSTELLLLCAAPQRRQEPNARLRHSAVMMIFIDREVNSVLQTHLIFIMKTSDGSRHGGQIAFPGGKVESGEEALAAALRETEEEIGVAPDQLEVFGGLGYFSTMTTGYDAAVFLARPCAPLRYAPHLGEVAAIFEIPVAALLEQFDPSLLIQTATDMLKLHFHLPAEPYLKSRTLDAPTGRSRICIWGFTARVLQHLFQTKMLLAS